LQAAMQAFEIAYARYDEHQRTLETYWALRWLLQEEIREIGATVLRENLVRVDGLPLVTRVSSLPALDPDTVVRLAVEEVDLIECKLLCRWIATPAGPNAGVCKEPQQARP